MKLNFGMVCSFEGWNELSELVSSEGLSKRPIWRGHIVWGKTTAIAGGDLEREGLAVEATVALPILPPVSGHRLPISVWAFDGDGDHISRASNIGYEHKVEERMTIYRKSDSSSLHARNSGREKWMEYKIIRTMNEWNMGVDYFDVSWFHKAYLDGKVNRVAEQICCISLYTFCTEQGQSLLWT